LEDDTITPLDLTQEKIKEPTTYYALFHMQADDGYVVTYDRNDGSDVEIIYVPDTDPTIDLPDGLTREGYTFAGWKIENE